MPTLLHSIKSIQILAGELHPTTLQIFDNCMVFIKRGIIKRNEATIAYNHVSQVYLRRGFITASIEIINTGGFENIEIKFLPIKEAIKAKKIIDEKVFHTHSRVSQKETNLVRDVPDLERKIARLKELLLKNMITEDDYKKRKKEILKDL